MSPTVRASGEYVGNNQELQTMQPSSLEDRAETHARIAEIGQILALGLVRLRARQSSQTEAGTGESSLDCVARQSGDANLEKPENGL